MKASRFIPFLLVSTMVVLLGSCELFNYVFGLPNPAVELPSHITVDGEYDLTLYDQYGWSVSVEDLPIRSYINKWYKITVPAKPAEFYFDLLGSNPYTHDSSLAVAAQHAGAITSSGGVFYVQIQGAGDSFYGSTANGITSTTNLGISYGFEVFSAP